MADPCEHCRKSPIPGVIVPAEFDDRGAVDFDRVFVACCDECGIFPDDVAAAEAVAAHTGWPLRQSFDYLDAYSEEERATKGASERGRSYFRPCFHVSETQAESVMGYGRLS